MSKEFDVAMIGLGPVGTISAACFAKQGFKVVGVDIDPKRVESFERNEAPFVEPGINEMLKVIQASGHFRATTNFAHAVSNSRIVMIAVGTPTPEESGEPDLSFLDNVSKSIGEAFKAMEQKGTVVVVRSTVPPGTMRNRMAPIIEQYSGLKAGEDFHVASNPEFLREGKAIDDFFDTGRIVIGSDSPVAGLAIEELYREVSGQRIHTTIESAEFAKYVDNTWHALKVAFANEIGRVVTAFGGSTEHTTKIFLADNKLNISPYYLRPGFAFGGSCLPKDVRGLSHFAKTHGVNLPVVTSIMKSNEEQIDQAVAAALTTGAKKIGLLGVAFKENVDDLRESPALYVAQKLRAAGIELLAHDPAYKKGEQLKLPRKGGMLAVTDLDTLTAENKVLILFHRIPEYQVLVKQKKAQGYTVIDCTTVVQESGGKPSVSGNGARPQSDNGRLHYLGARANDEISRGQDGVSTIQ